MNNRNVDKVMKDVSELFKVNANTIYEFFTKKNLTTGFIIPEYQRVYSWDTNHIERLIDDIREGVISIRNDSGGNESITFVGTVICSKLKDFDFEGDVLSVVDGQQRMTTLLLICVSLHQKLTGLSSILKEDSNTDVEFLEKKVVKTVLTKLFAVFAGQFSPLPETSEEMFPRLIREGYDFWSQNPKDRYYVSPASEVVFKYIEYVLGEKKEFVALELKDRTETKDSIDFFLKNMKSIDNALDALAEGESFGAIKDEGLEVEPLPNADSLLNNSKYRSSLLSSVPLMNDEQASSIINSESFKQPDFKKLIRLVAFSNYLIKRVAITKVVATSDNYAFDIFEALNTAGEPLTALETFKPIVFRDEERMTKEGFSRSKSKIIFDELREYLESSKFKDAEKRQRESKEVVVILALVLDGRKESLHLNSQRKYLRIRYEKLETIEEKQSLVNELGNVLQFRKDFWDKDRYSALFNGYEDREELLVCMDFIRGMKTYMATPVLTRYYEFSNTPQGYLQFLRAVKSTTAFIILWRAYYGGTAGIDTIFRELMKKSFCKSKTGHTKLLDVKELVSEYRRILKNKVDLLDKDVWVDGVVSQPLYAKSKVLCRMMILIYSNDSDSVSANSFLLRKGRKNSGVNLMNLNKFRSSEFSTLEHIAPQNPANKSSWDGGIYKTPFLRNSIGNLILMPQKENSNVGNKGWDIKKVYYAAYCETSNEGVSSHVASAKKMGFSFKKTTVSLIEDGECLPTLKYIAGVEDWNADVIRKRSENIAELVWNDLVAWID